eukprot:1158527-Pelagomonas_calceolata.AAC.5
MKNHGVWCMFQKVPDPPSLFAWKAAQWLGTPHALAGWHGQHTFPVTDLAHTAKQLSCPGRQAQLCNPFHSYRLAAKAKLQVKPVYKEDEGYLIVKHVVQCVKTCRKPSVLPMTDAAPSKIEKRKAQASLNPCYLS